MYELFFKLSLMVISSFGSSHEAGNFEYTTWFESSFHGVLPSPLTTRFDCIFLVRIVVLSHII